MKLFRRSSVCAAFAFAALIFCRPLMTSAASATIPAPSDETIPNAASREKILLARGWRFGANTAIGGISKSDDGKNFTLDFDGVSGACGIWVNGYFVGRHDGGRAPFWFDISDYLNYGGRNILTVRADASSADDQSAKTAGINRSVRLIQTAPLHIAYWGVSVRTETVPSHATALVRSVLQNDADAKAHCDVVWQILDAAGKQVALMAQPAEVPAHGETPVSWPLNIEHPQLWTPDSPYLYSLITKVMQGGKVVDETRTTFGIRMIEIVANGQLLLNEKRVEIKHAKVAADDPNESTPADPAGLRSRLATLKTAGANTLRTSQGAPSRELLDACDQMGVLVIEENHYPASEPAALAALRSLILRDRNHPCVICWSIVVGEKNTPVEKRIGNALKRLAKQLDPTRPVFVVSDNGFNF